MSKKVLFVSERWCDGLPQRGESNTEHNLFTSLETSGLADRDNLFVDEHHLSYGRKVDGTLVNYCAIYRPDVVVVSPLVGSRLNPEPTTLDKIRDMGIPVAVVWWDTVYEQRMEYADVWAPHVDLAVVVDRFDFTTKFPDKYIHTWVPQDTNIFCNPGLERTEDVVFLGSTHPLDHRRRRQAIDALKASGVNVFVGGDQRNENIPIEEYAKLFQTAKIVLNFPWTVSICPAVSPYQMKARVFEATLCGALLVEGDNPYTPKWLTPGEDYVSYQNTEDLVDKVKYYLDHPVERQAIADQGCKKATSNYNARKFWELILNRVKNDDLCKSPSIQ